MNKWFIYIKGLLSLFMVINCMFTLYYCLDIFRDNSQIVQDIDIFIKSVSTNVTDKQNIVFDVTLENNSDRSIYNVEILTEPLNKEYVKAFGNTVCKTAEEIKPNDSLYLRSTYEKSNNDTINTSYYQINEYDIHKVWLLLGVYIFMACLLLYIVFKLKHWSFGIFGELIIFVLSVFVVAYFVKYQTMNKDRHVIYSYEDYIDINVGNKTEGFRILVNYTINNLDSLIDKNNDGLPDIREFEDYFRDTDGDGLPDYYELYVCRTNPYMLDTYGIGSGDVNYDTDEDGISNLREYELGSNPFNVDTDYDGVDDLVELELGTGILAYDTDGDGMSDGFEIAQGYDPLIKDTSVVVSKELESKVKEYKNRVTASVEVSTQAANAETLDINTYETFLVNKDMPGYIGSAFEFSIDDEFNYAVINFDINEYWLNKKDCDPCIYYFNEDTQLLEELETTINDNTLSTKVEHFSVYVVLDRTEVNKWLHDDIASQIQNKTIDATNYISFVVDISYSMVDIDPENKVNELILDFVDLLSDKEAELGLVTFTLNGKKVCDFTNDYTKIKTDINNIQRDDGKSLGSGTDIIEGLRVSIDTFNKLEGNKYIVLITDGDAVDYTTEAALLPFNGVSVYCLDMSGKHSKFLGNIAKRTGGAYYLASKVSLVSITKEFKELQESIVDAESTIGDGLTNYEKSLIENSVLSTGTGLVLFNDVDFSSWYTNPDVDGDTLDNGEEISVETHNGHTYIKLRSNPFVADTDLDGIRDDKDTAPFTYGLKDGVIGEIYLAAHETYVDGYNLVVDMLSNKWNTAIHNNIDTGHAWIVLHNYCDVVFDNTKFNEGHYKVILWDRERAVTSHNMYPYKLIADSYASFGYYPSIKDGEEENTGKTSWPDNITKEEIGQIVYEQMRLHYKEPLTEMEKHRVKEVGEDILYAEMEQKALSMGNTIYASFRINQEIKNSIGNYNYYKGAVGLKREVTYTELRRFIENVRIVPNYGIGSYNCTNFALEQWNMMWGAGKEDNRVDYTHYLFGLPTELSNKLKERDGVLENFGDLMYAWWYAMKPLIKFDFYGKLIE